MISSINPTIELSIFILLKADVSWNIIFFSFAQFNPSLYSTVLRYPRSILFPRTINTANQLALSLTCSYHFSRFSNDYLLVVSQTSITPTAFLQNMFDSDSYLSSPTVSQHCIEMMESLLLIGASQSLVAYSTPRVFDVRRLNSFLVNRLMMLDFPTQESPTNTTLMRQRGLPQMMVCLSYIQQECYENIKINNNDINY